MDVATIELRCYGGQGSYGRGSPLDEQHVFGTVDLQAEQDFFAWCDLGYVNGLKTPWDFDNGMTAEVFAVDGDRLPSRAYNGKLGRFGSPSNLHPMAYRGRGQYVAFRLRVFHPEEMEAAAQGIVMYGL